MTAPKSTYRDNYRLVAKESDPEIKLPLAPEFLKELMQRSKENGRSFEVEIALRLARSLEDVDILDSDLEAVREKRRRDLERRKPKPLKTVKK